MQKTIKLKFLNIEYELKKVKTHTINFIWKTKSVFWFQIEW